MIRHECGLLGIYGHEEAARLTYFGLYAQQHRGQESAGIVTIDEKGLLHEHKGMGLVPDVFAEANLQALPGTISLGHVRYSTTGRSAARNAQPFVAHYKGLDIAIAHNGNLVNTMELREELENDGAIFSTTNDTEVFMHLIVRALREHDLVDAIREACARVRGAYCLLVYAGGTMVAVRDPHGFHPLALGRLDGAPVLASETCAFDLLEADYERPIQPGEMLIMDGKGEHSEQLRGPLPERPRQCIFELVYFARPDGMADEPKLLCLGGYGGMDFFQLKGAVERILAGLRITGVTFEAESSNPSYHPGRCAKVYAGGKLLGVLGQIHPLVAANYGVDTEFYTAELQLGEMLAERGATPVYTPLPRFPAVTRDVAVVCSADIPVAKLSQCILAAGGQYLKGCELFDVYTGAPIPAGYKSVAFSLTLRADDQTLTDDHAEETMQSVLKALEETFHATIR